MAKSTASKDDYEYDEHDDHELDADDAGDMAFFPLVACQLAPVRTAGFGAVSHGIHHRQGSI